MGVNTLLNDIINQRAQELAQNIDGQILSDLRWEHALKTHKNWHLVTIPWRLGDTEQKWNETCAWAIEQFGLPGEKYVTHPTKDYMEFLFKNEQDAIMFSLRWL